jgi:pyridoxamine 5'-phosphate oxidase family protein
MSSNLPRQGEEVVVSLTRPELDYLAGQRLGRVATASSSGEPDVAPVSFKFGPDGTIEIGSLDNPNTIKWRNVIATGRAAFVVDDIASIEPWRPRGIKLRGAARPDSDGDRQLIRITPETIWSWGINPDAPKHFVDLIERRTANKEPSQRAWRDTGVQSSLPLPRNPS